MAHLFILRDDDLNYFSTPSDIQRWYGDVFAQGVPVGFATIPFVRPNSDVYTGATQKEDREYPISENKELVEYVRANSLIEILQHGCTHVTENGIFEYAKETGLEADTVRGKTEISAAFGIEPQVFVAPHDRISNHGLLALEHAQLNLIRGKGTRNFLPRMQYVGAFVRMALHRVRFGRLSRDEMPAYPRTLSLGGHKESFAIRIESGEESLLRALHYADARAGNFIVTMHVHDMTEQKKEKLRALIQEGKKLGFTFAKPSALFAASRHD